MRLFSYELFRGEYGRSKQLFIIDGILRNAVGVLTSGVYLSGFVVLLKGSDFLTGLINSSVNWVSVAALLSFLLFERFRKRKKLLVYLLAISRFMTCSVVFLPLVFRDSAYILKAVFVMVLIGNIVNTLYNTGFMVWLFGILPLNSRNEYMYVLTFFSRIAAAGATIAGGLVLDWFHKGYTGFLVVFGAGLILSLLDVIMLVNIDDPGYPEAGEGESRRNMLLEPVRDGRFRSFLVFVFLFHLCLYMSATYTSLYQIRYLRLDYSFISSLTVVQLVFMISFIGFWKKVEEKAGLYTVFRVTALFALLELPVYGMVSENIRFLLFLAPILSGIGYSGFNITIVNYRYTLIPDKNRTVYEGWFAAVFGVSTLTAPFMGDMLLRSIPAFKNIAFQHGNFQLLYLISFAMTLGVVYLAFWAPGGTRLLHRNPGHSGAEPERPAQKTDKGSTHTA